MSINMSNDILGASGYTPNSEIVFPQVVTDGLVGWWDWGNHASWMDSDSNYYRCGSGFGCDYYATPPTGCYACFPDIPTGTGMTLDMSGYLPSSTYNGLRSGDMRHIGNAVVIPSDVGRVLYLDGTRTFLSSLDFNYAADISGEVTIMAWVYPLAPLTTGQIVSNNYNSGYRYRINSNGSIYFYVSGNAITSSAGDVTAGRWHNICVDGDSSGKTAYVNNTQVASNGTAFNPSASGYTLIGTYNGTESFKGYMALILLYDRKLTDVERTQCYHATLPRFTSSDAPQPTPSPTRTPTPTISVTPSITPSRTPSITPTRTPSRTPSRTPTPTPSASPVPTPGTISSVVGTDIGPAANCVYSSSSNADNYRVQYSISPFSVWNPSSGGGAFDAFSPFTTTLGNGTWRFRVCGENASGLGPYTTSASFVMS